jgi:uncharacterized caspase-like protein
MRCVCGRLLYPRSDAEDTALALKRLGFEVISGFDLDDRATAQKVRDFARAVDGAMACYQGAVDDSWGQSSRRAVERFNASTKLALAADPTPQAVTQVKGFAGRVCEPMPTHQQARRPKGEEDAQRTGSPSGAAIRDLVRGAIGGYLRGRR